MVTTVVSVNKWVLKERVLNIIGRVLATWKKSPAWFFSDDALPWNAIIIPLGLVWMFIGGIASAADPHLSFFYFLFLNGLSCIVLFLTISVIMFAHFFADEPDMLPKKATLLDNYFKQRISRLRKRLFGDSSRFARFRTKRQKALEVSRAQLGVLNRSVSDSAFTASGREKLEQAIVGLEKDEQALAEYMKAAGKHFAEMEKMLAAEKFQAFLAQFEAVSTAGRLGHCMAPVMTGYLGELDAFNAQFRSIANKITALPFPKMMMKLK